MKMTPLKYHPRHAIDENGYLYRKTAKVGVFVPCRPHIHHLSPATAPVTFYFDQEGESYKLTQEQLKRDGENAKGKLL